MKKNLFLSLLGLLGLLFCSASAPLTNPTGKASYYSRSFHGRRTSSGSLYHNDSLTCAHRTLPFGTRLKVRNLENGREVVVEVTDRGPFVKGRIIDLSHAAADALNMIHRGVTHVRIELMDDEDIQVPLRAEINSLEEYSEMMRSTDDQPSFTPSITFDQIEN